MSGTDVGCAAISFDATDDQVIPILANASAVFLHIGSQLGPEMFAGAHHIAKSNAFPLTFRTGRIFPFAVRCIPRRLFVSFASAIPGRSLAFAILVAEIAAGLAHKVRRVLRGQRDTPPSSNAPAALLGCS
eukprot:1824126-Rhodomonas_salina.4